MAAKSGVCNCKKVGTNTLLRKIQQGTLPEETEKSRIVVSLPIGCVYCSGSHGDGPLLVAARYGHLDIVKTLCEKYGSPLEMGNNDGKRPLHEAAQNGHIECAQYLISRGARIDALKQADWTPLMLACTKSSRDMVELLVREGGASMHLRNKDGWTPFHIACREGRCDIIAYLLHVSPRCWNTQSKNGRTPLHTADHGGRWGEDVCHSDANDAHCPYFYLSALHGRVDTLRLLRERYELELSKCGYHGDERDSCGVTPLMDAARANHIEAAQFLISEYECALSATDDLGRCSLHHSSQAGAVNTTELLVAAGMDLNSRASTSQLTPLHYAAKEGQTEVVLRLLQLGADTKARDKQGRTAGDIAKSSRHWECAELLCNDIH